MKNKLAIKLSVIVMLSVVLLVPLHMIEGAISARQQRQAEVKANIAQTAAGEQKLVGPFIAVMYKERVEKREKENGKENISYETVTKHLFLPPRHLNVKGGVTVETLYRGLYPARVFHANLALACDFRLAQHLGLAPERHILEARAFLILDISDLRGVENDPTVAFGGAQRPFTTGTNDLLKRQGMQADLGDVDLARETAYDFSFPLQLSGTERLSIAPAGDETTVSLNSDWPHPSFQGSFLPRSRKVSADGFEAEWHTSHLARSFESVLQSDIGMDVRFMDPVNIYLQSERAVKYGLLFVTLTFGAFFLTEILRKLALHFVHYLLVGLALAVFFLLVIALSEHLSFALAYLVSSVACVGLIGAYLAGVLDSRAGGSAFAAGLAGLYGVLYVVLLSEDNALLMGSVVIFIALGTVMLTTRRLNWHSLAESLAG